MTNKENYKRPVVIIVEDDKAIAELLEFNLQNEGYASYSFSSSKELFRGLEQIKETPALFILDLMLPEMSGFEICTKLKADSRYELSLFMILTARSSEQDKVKGLELGADDYVTKPFSMREFLARIRGLLRRHLKMLRLSDGQSESLEIAVDDQDLIICQEICIDDKRHRVFLGEKELEMTHREYELLKFLMLHRGIAYSRDDLLNYVWGYDYSGETRTVDVHIRQLRRKLEKDSSKPKYIETVRGRGYRFCED